MLNKPFFATYGSLAISNKKDKHICKFKIETTDFDYSDIARYSKSIHDLILAIQPMIFKSIDFGDQEREIELIVKDTQTTIDDSELQGVFKAEITNLTVINDDQVPRAVFTIELDAIQDTSVLIGLLKHRVEIELRG